jgi:Ca2+-binding RTX toxin-like protein
MLLTTAWHESASWLVLNGVPLVTSSSVTELVAYGGSGDDLIDLSGISLSQSNLTVARLYGGEGNDTLIGSPGHDYLYGEDGDDTLTGGAGNDSFSGGTGTNTFVDVDINESTDRPIIGEIAVVFVDNRWVLNGRIENDMLGFQSVIIGGDFITSCLPNEDGAFELSFPETLSSGWISVSYTNAEGIASDSIWLQLSQ